MDVDIAFKGGREENCANFSAKLMSVELHFIFISLALVYNLMRIKPNEQSF